MAHIPMDDVKQLYNSSGHSWGDLLRTVESDSGKTNGIGDYLVIDLKHALKDMNQSEPYPDSPEKLYEKLNTMLEGMPHQTTKARAAYGND